jgi:hypothetical protein
MLPVLLKSFMFTASRALTFITTPPLPPTPQNAVRALCLLAFSPALRNTHVVIVLLKKNSSELETVAGVFLTLLIKLVGGETNA